MSINLRSGTPADAEACGQIVYEAFKTIHTYHNFPPDFPSAEVATNLLSMMLRHPGSYSVVAERDGNIIGSNFLDERSPIAGVGPLTVDPSAQDRGVGRLLMQNVLERAADRGAPGVRLLQDTFHNRSLSLYSKLGFQVRELTSVMQGSPVRTDIPGASARPATERDLESCNRLCGQVHGYDRGGELSDAIQQGTAMVVERDGRITGYCTMMAFFGHAVGEANDDLKALIAAAPGYLGPGFHVPTRNHDLLNWCLEAGLRIVKPMTLMTTGAYKEPCGAYLPSVSY